MQNLILLNYLSRTLHSVCVGFFFFLKLRLELYFAVAKASGPGQALHLTVYTNTYTGLHILLNNV